MHWELLLEAFCIALLIEGVPLFIAPRHIKDSALSLSRMDNFTLRIIGLCVVAAGALLMVLVNT